MDNESWIIYPCSCMTGGSGLAGSAVLESWTDDVSGWLARGMHSRPMRSGLLYLTSDRTLLDEDSVNSIITPLQPTNVNHLTARVRGLYENERG